jgi:hypothetical protein
MWHDSFEGKMKAQTITLTTDDGQTLTLQVTSAKLGEVEIEEEPIEETTTAPTVTPMERLKQRRAEKMMA